MRRLRVPSLNTQSPQAITTWGLLLVVLVGFLDVVTGYQVSFSLLYLAPITLVTWGAGRRWGVAIASLSTLVWLGADILSAQSALRADF